MNKPTIVLALVASLSACGSQDRCATTSNPTECRQWSDAGGDIDDYLIGGMMGYMLANRGGQTVIVQNPSYHGPYRTLHRPILSESRQIDLLRAKVQRQKAELQRQQTANARKNAQLKAYRSSGSPWSSRSSSWSSRSSYSASFRPAGRK